MLEPYFRPRDGSMLRCLKRIHVVVHLSSKGKEYRGALLVTCRMIQVEKHNTERIMAHKNVNNGIKIVLYNANTCWCILGMPMHGECQGMPIYAS